MRIKIDFLLKISITITQTLNSTQTLNMPLTCIRPVYCNFVGQNVPHIGQQIYNHFKNTPNEYHGVFSHPEMMFSLSLIKTTTFRKLLMDFPKIFDKTKSYFIDFVFENEMWDLIPTKTPFTRERFNIVKETYTIFNPLLHKFVKEWMDENLDENTRHEYLFELITKWKSVSWDSTENKKKIIDICKFFKEDTYASVYQKIMEEDIAAEKKRFENLPARFKGGFGFDKRYEDLKEFADRTREMSYLSIQKIIKDSLEDQSDIGEVFTSINKNKKLDIFNGGSTGYGSYECGSDDDTESDSDDEE